MREKFRLHIFKLEKMEKYIQSLGKNTDKKKKKRDHSDFSESDNYIHFKGLCTSSLCHGCRSEFPLYIQITHLIASFMEFISIILPNFMQSLIIICMKYLVYIYKKKDDNSTHGFWFLYVHIHLFVYLLDTDMENY